MQHPSVRRGEKILVTGGAGYVGSLLVRNLLIQGYKVLCLDCLKFGGQSLLGVWGNPAFEFEKVDVTDFETVKYIFSTYKVNSVVHLAAIVGDPACKLQPDLARKTNLDASLNLLDQAIQQHVPRFVFASTCSNYGKMPDPNEYVTEESPLRPVSLYAELKVSFEKALLNSGTDLDWFSPTALRFATVYGISPRMRFDLTVNEFTKELALGRELTIFGERFWRPYCHVNDFSKAIIATLQAPRQKVAHAVFNVGDTSQNFTKRMIVDEITRQVTDAKVRYVQKGEDPRDYRVRFEKIQRELGFRISRTMPEGIKEVLEAISSGIIENPDDQIYYNIPVKP